MGTNHPWVESRKNLTKKTIAIAFPNEGRLLIFVQDRTGAMQPCLLSIQEEESESTFFERDPISLSWDEDEPNFDEEESDDIEEEDEDLIDDDLFDDEEDDDYDDDYDDLEEEDDDYDDFDDVEVDQEEEDDF